MNTNVMSEALQVRNARPEDVPAILSLVRKTYGGSEIGSADPEMFLAQISNYPEGQLVVEFDGKVVGYAACFRIGSEKALKPHT